MLIKPYYPGVKFKNFPELHSILPKHYDKMYNTVVDDIITPRYFYEGIKVGFWDIFYYIDTLYDNDPKSVIDVGCGECIWKKWFPHIIGFDPTPGVFANCDFVDHFDENFSCGHARQYDAGLALNSIHFINWADIPHQIDLAMNLVTDKFLFTFNFDPVLNKPNLPTTQLMDLFDDILLSLNYDIVLLDYPLQRNEGVGSTNTWSWPQINGHVRFILQHKKESK